MYNFSYGPRLINSLDGTDLFCFRPELGVPCCGPDIRECYGWASHSSELT